MSKQARLSVRCDQVVLDEAHKYARSKSVPLAQLVDQFLRELGRKNADQPRTDEELGVEQA